MCYYNVFTRELFLVPYHRSNILVEPIKNYILSIPIKETQDGKIKNTESEVVKLVKQL